MSTACAGLRVVEISPGMSGALAGMILADFGADVVRLESPRGDPYLSVAGARVWSRGKARVALDMNDAEQRTRAATLIREADVVLTGVRPTTAERWGLSYEALAANDPEIIFATITGFGWDGPARDQPMSEALMQALSGAMTAQANGSLREGPVFIAPHSTAYAAALLAVQGTMAALRERDGSGQGQHVDVGLYQAMLVYRGIQMWEPEHHPEDFPSFPATTDPRGVRPLFNLNQCADGRWLSMGAWTPALTYRALEVMGLVDLLGDERFAGTPNFFPDDSARRDLLNILWDRFKERPMQEWLDAMDAENVPCEPVLTVAEFRDVGQIWANQHAIRVHDPVVGPMIQHGVLGEFSVTPGLARPAEATPRPAAAVSEIASRWRQMEAVRGSGRMRAGGRGPLAGVRVLDLTMFLSGPMAGHLLADLGADVVKAEPPEGDDFRMSAPTVFRFLHRDKQGVMLDLKTPEGRDGIRQLVERSDVVLYNYRLGVEDRLGLSYDELRAISPEIIVCRITAFGPHGERAHRGGYDASVTAMSGMFLFQAGAGNPPVSVTLADISTGLAAATAISLAIRHKETSGRGQSIDITMIGAMSYVGGDAFPDFEGKSADEQVDAGQHGFGPFYRLYRTQDGWVMVAPSHTQAPALRQVTGIAEGTPPDIGALEQLFASRSTGDWIETLERAGVACADPNVDAKTFLHSVPELRANGAAVAVQHPRYGRLGQAGPAIRFSRTPVRIERQEPGLGEHNDKILGPVPQPGT